MFKPQVPVQRQLPRDSHGSTGQAAGRLLCPLREWETGPERLRGSVCEQYSCKESTSPKVCVMALPAKIKVSYSSQVRVAPLVVFSDCT